MAYTKNTDKGLLYIKRNESASDKAPYLKGFVSIPVELLEKLNQQEPDNYGSVRLDVAVWKNEEQPGVLKGVVEQPYKLRAKEQEESKPAPQAKRKPASEDCDF